MVVSSPIPTDPLQCDVDDLPTYPFRQVLPPGRLDPQIRTRAPRFIRLVPAFHWPGPITPASGQVMAL